MEVSFSQLQNFASCYGKKMWQSSTLVISNHFFYPLSFLHNLCSIAALVLGEFVHKHSISSQAQLLQFGLLCSCLAGLRRCCVAGVQVQLVGAGCRSWLQVWFKQRSRSYAMRWWQLYQVKSPFLGQLYGHLCDPPPHRAAGHSLHWHVHRCELPELLAHHYKEYQCFSWTICLTAPILFLF